ncbi:TnsA-like heteromeric transposase endonuclease subunit [Kitasatospora sp. NPDC058063]|uniref:TnsA-like heteromeric transposase endonuclease subunit n=1 Tax=unclassified Kitasatospora TaxID=2633591 RepID=UPI0036D7EF9F
MSATGMLGTGFGSGVWSASCTVDDLLVAYEPGQADGAVLDVGPGWKRRWTTTWCLDGAELVCPVAELEGVPVGRTRPVRGFSWHPRQGHRPGLELLVSTGRLHGFESLEERRFLRAADFAGSVRDVLSQPFRLRYRAAGRTRTHIPDYLVVTRGGRWLVDVRPLHLVKDVDRPGFAAAAELARAVGWQYSVVVGWRPHVSGAVEALRAEARPMSHLLDLQERMVSVLADGAMPFGDLVRATPYPVMARAHALHLLWHRRIGVDLAEPLGDGSVVALAGGTPR